MARLTKMTSELAPRKINSVGTRMEETLAKETENVALQVRRATLNASREEKDEINNYVF